MLEEGEDEEGAADSGSAKLRCLARLPVPLSSSPSSFSFYCISSDFFYVVR
jgi:hypothetical protein